jgi:hypothetical protein
MQAAEAEAEAAAEAEAEVVHAEAETAIAEVLDDEVLLADETEMHTDAAAPADTASEPTADVDDEAPSASSEQPDES